MEIEYTLKAKEDIEFWKMTGNKVLLKKITSLIKDIEQQPFVGLGKPEQLKHEWLGYWSRRINREHRLIYEVFPDKIIIHSLCGHYNK